ncbi:hypothetical protein T4A_478 [Trichinella pseudospiralis]|uniref:Uncharacterized protein n=1 Tax=Trichinella pseudospiralis TaxID=6337 RepID=A0A0V1E2D0_TRIPS|nr:hypothetical protein T4A_478 [Trichinella pseudospiralis]
MVNVKQDVNIADYFGFIVVLVTFFVIIFVISTTCILWFCVDKHQEATVFDKWRGRRKGSAASRKPKHSMLISPTNY